MLDTVVKVETPEGVDLNLRVAGPMVRFLAWLIDSSLRLTLFFFLAIPLAVLGDAGGGLMLIAFFALEWLYPVGWEAFYHGSTPGKLALGLRVVLDDGRPVDLGAAVIRNLLRAADFLPLAYVGALLSMCTSSTFKRLGDHVAGTVVVYDRPERPPRPLPKVKPLPPAVPLTVEEQRAVEGFARRLESMALARCDELAALAEPLVRAYPEHPPRDVLIGVAAWLDGAGRAK